jgi:hypothetical protein
MDSSTTSPSPLLPACLPVACPCCPCHTGRWEYVDQLGECIGQAERRSRLQIPTLPRHNSSLFRVGVGWLGSRALSFNGGHPRLGFRSGVGGCHAPGESWAWRRVLPCIATFLCCNGGCWWFVDSGPRQLVLPSSYSVPCAAGARFFRGFYGGRGSLPRCGVAKGRKAVRVRPSMSEL